MMPCFLLYNTFEYHFQPVRLSKIGLRHPVVETGGNDFILGFDVLQNFEFDREGILLEGGEVKIYTRG